MQDNSCRNFASIFSEWTPEVDRNFVQGCVDRWQAALRTRQAALNPAGRSGLIIKKSLQSATVSMSGCSSTACILSGDKTALTGSTWQIHGHRGLQCASHGQLFFERLPACVSTNNRIRSMFAEAKIFHNYISYNPHHPTRKCLLIMGFFLDSWTFLAEVRKKLLKEEANNATITTLHSNRT